MKLLPNMCNCVPPHLCLHNNTNKQSFAKAALLFILQFSQKQAHSFGHAERRPANLQAGTLRAKKTFPPAHFAAQQHSKAQRTAMILQGGFAVLYKIQTLAVHLRAHLRVPRALPHRAAHPAAADTRPPRRRAARARCRAATPPRPPPQQPQQLAVTLLTAPQTRSAGPPREGPPRPLP